MLLYPSFTQPLHETTQLTNLRKRLNNVLLEIEMIRKELENSWRYPSCCLIFHKNGEISCDAKGKMPKEQFLRECEKCRALIRNFLDYINIEKKKTKRQNDIFSMCQEKEKEDGGS